MLESVQLTAVVEPAPEVVERAVVVARLLVSDGHVKVEPVERRMQKSVHAKDDLFRLGVRLR